MGHHQDNWKDLWSKVEIVLKNLTSLMHSIKIHISVFGSYLSLMPKLYQVTQYKESCLIRNTMNLFELHCLSFGFFGGVLFGLVLMFYLITTKKTPQIHNTIIQQLNRFWSQYTQCFSFPCDKTIPTKLEVEALSWTLYSVFKKIHLFYHIQNRF